MAVGCCLASSVVWLTGAGIASRAPSFPSGVNRLTISRGATGPSLRALQLNLCDSGIASCYSGRSVAAAAAVIHERRPDIVTLNEVCRGDVSELKQAMSNSHRSTFVASAFKAAPDRAPNGPFRCRDGQQYGIGALALTPSSESGYGTYGGVYPIQDLATLKNGCGYASMWPTRFMHALRTPPAPALMSPSLSAAISWNQLRQPCGARAAPIPLSSARINLLAGRSPDPESCLPRGYQRADDGSRQDIVVSPGIALRSPTIIDMHRTTDHPGCLSSSPGHPRRRAINRCPAITQSKRIHGGRVAPAAGNCGSSRRLCRAARDWSSQLDRTLLANECARPAAWSCVSALRGRYARSSPIAEQQHAVRSIGIRPLR